MKVYNVNFIRDNGENLSYVYYIVVSVLDCTAALLRRAEDEDADDDDVLWNTCNSDDLI